MLTPLVKALAVKYGAVDQPNQRKVHVKVVPKLGGIAIFLGFLAAVLLPDLFYGHSISSQTWLIIGGSIGVVCLGAIDDIYNLKAPIKLLGQIIIACVVVGGGLEISYINNPFSSSVISLGVFSKFVSLIWILVLMNIINLIDGLDGLAAGVVFISAISLWGISLILNQLAAVYILLAVAGAALGFLRHNFNPASIFMGDTGSLFLGYILAVSSITGVLKSSVIVCLSVPFLTFLIPLMDMLMAIVRRVRSGKHIFRADKEHIHHKLMQMGFSHKQAVLVIYAVSIFLNVLAVILALTSGLWSVLVLIVIIVILWRAGLYIKNQKKIKW